MNLDHLRTRAELLGCLRAFFRDRAFLEVETPAISREMIPERHIEPIGVAAAGAWLQPSPEMHHKRLLCEGSGPIFEVSRVFRGGELGARHRPEFTLVEWYRPGDDTRAGMDLLEELLRTLLDAPAAKRTTYREAFRRAGAPDPFDSSTEDLADAAGRLLAGGADELPEERDELLNVLLSGLVEPTLGVAGPELLHHYPASQAALAETTRDDRGESVAERFELYWRGLELANGYHELTDPVELRRRLEAVNAARVAAGLPTLPLPERLLAAMHAGGLPPSAGVALGFDRLVMLAVGAASISDVVAFSD